MRSPVLMHRLRVALLVLLAVVVAAQLTLHNHSLIPEGVGAASLPCAVCAFGADTAPPTPAVGVALVVVFLLVAAAHSPFSSPLVAPVDSRGPPRSRR
jgi:hypothetical protein